MADKFKDNPNPWDAIKNETRMNTDNLYVNTSLQVAVNAAVSEKDCVTNTSSYSSQLKKCPELSSKSKNPKGCVTTLKKALQVKGFYLNCKGKNLFNAPKLDDNWDKCLSEAVINFKKKQGLKKHGLSANDKVGPKTKGLL